MSLHFLMKEFVYEFFLDSWREQCSGFCFSLKVKCSLQATMSPFHGAVWEFWDLWACLLVLIDTGGGWGLSSPSGPSLSIPGYCQPISSLYSPVTTGWYSVSAKVPMPWWTVFFHLWARVNSPKHCACQLYGNREKKKLTIQILTLSCHWYWIPPINYEVH